MASQGFTHSSYHGIAIARIWWIGLLAIVAAVIVNAVIDVVALSIFHVSAAFSPLQWLGVALSTAIGVAGAVGVFALVTRFAQRPIRAFWLIATIALLITFVPDIAILLNPSSIVGTTPLAVGALMTMHLTAAAITVGLLTTLTHE
ncbi:MAG TPA: DUF6069 family protein [Ktedonobacteraceae bacterium]|nr:DUF6069 family protein [Ktedonobacteraceae bacterium]